MSFLDNLTAFLFLAAAAPLLLLERQSKLRRAEATIEYRWLTNLGLMLGGALTVSFVYPDSLTDVASQLNSGLLFDLHLPLALEVPVVFLLLDCWRYWEHRLFHEVPLLWRTHLVHHSDTAVDVTTAQRHHPLETAITTFIALILVFALGFSVYALGIYLLLASLSSLYTHTNMDLPESIDRPLRRWLVTPAVHAVHHSAYQPETDSNYGSILSIWDRLFGTYTDPASVRVSRFGLAYFSERREAALGPVLLQPFVYDPTRSHALPATGSYDERVEHRPALCQAWRQVLYLWAAGTFLALLALWPTLVDMAGLWRGAEAYQYAWLVVPMLVYVVGWHHRDSILSLSPAPCYAGMVVVLAGITLWLTAYLVDIRLGQHIALVIILQGVALSSLGSATYRRLLPIMLMLFLLVPCGDLLQIPLRNLTVKWIEWFAVVLGLPHSVEGYIIYVGDHRYAVVDACSGLSFVTLAGFLGYSFGLLLFRSLNKVLAMAALGAALGVMTNAVRVWLIIGLDWLRGSQMDLEAHSDIQLLVLLVSLAGLLLIASRSKQESWPEVTDSGSATPALPGARFAPLAAGIMTVATIGLTQSYAPAFQARSNQGAMPLEQMAELSPEAQRRGDPGPGIHALEIPHSENIDILLVATWDGTVRIDDKLMTPEDSTGWRHTDTDLYRDCAADHCIEFVHKTWRQRGERDTRHSLHAYFVGDRVTDSKLVFRLANGWRRLWGQPLVSGLIGFEVRGPLPGELNLAGPYSELKARLNQFSPGYSGESSKTQSISAEGREVQFNTQALLF